MVYIYVTAGILIIIAGWKVLDAWFDALKWNLYDTLSDKKAKNKIKKHSREKNDLMTIRFTAYNIKKERWEWHGTRTYLN